MEKKYCDYLHTYGALTKELDETEWLQVFERRYICYRTFMDIGKDREYCDQTSKTEQKFYECLDRFKDNERADYCIYSTKGALRTFGGPPAYRTCLSKYGIPADASECSYLLKQHQEDIFFNKTTLNKTLISDCLAKHGLNSEIIGCELDADPFYKFIYW